MDGLRTTPWKHQAGALEFVSARPAAMLHMAMGTGKSLVVVAHVVRRACRRVLILCPKAVVAVWEREFGKHAEKPPTVYASTTGTTAARSIEIQLAAKRYDRLAVVVNYDAAWRGDLAKTLLGTIWDCVVLDESHRIKAASGKASKFCDKLRHKARQRLCLTGTPMPHSPLDIFGQMRFLDPNVLGRWYTAFRSRYAVVNPMFPSQVREWINQEELAAKLAPVTYRVDNDVLDLPGSIHSEIGVELSAKAMRVYRDLEREMIAEADAGIVTAANALVKGLRLQQITSGFVRTDDEITSSVDDAKRDALEDLLDDLPIREPVVVFCRFRHDIEVVRKSSERSGRRFGEVSGERNDLVAGCYPPNVDTLAVQIQSGGVGVDLTRAAYAVYYSLGFSLGDYLQSLARLDRPGQTRPVRYYHLIANGTIDRHVYSALAAKREVVDAILEWLRARKENVA